MPDDGAKPQLSPPDIERLVDELVDLLAEVLAWRHHRAEEAHLGLEEGDG
jgi:hypothetical protein